MKIQLLFSIFEQNCLLLPFPACHLANQGWWELSREIRLRFEMTGEQLFLHHSAVHAIGLHRENYGLGMG